ncbi:hypothetical protein FSP39_008507 [Pinctada imbricata]|uniref:SRCR domain-containing protein n=1 Tax=Pinctada imbricata TaxID=66713 RepID=A0AA88XN16_PINIB|nr:hypothetical protein FSP39_008507 [Pinctada imbricata]
MLSNKVSLFKNFERVNFSFNPALFKDISILPMSARIIENEGEILHVRLVNGGTYYGRVEVYIYGKGWGTVCDDSFGSADANVVCRQLGFRSGSARSSAYYGEGTVDIIMDDVTCTGSEKALQQCRYISNHNCGHSEDVSVDCSN